MNQKRSIRINLFGLWVFGLLAGANGREFLPGEPSLPAWLLLIIGLLGSLVMFIALIKATQARQA